MARLNTDTVCAIVILAAGGVFFWATFHIPKMGYASLGAEVWPRVVLVLLFALTFAYLFQSLKRGPDEKGEGGGVMGWIGRYQNALWCYALFGGFLYTLNYLGMLIGGTLFVFLTLTALGERTLRAHAVHAAVAFISIAFMWSIFTYGLKVILPQGEIFSAW
ncbi:MAG: tripartite tricarboxylate transporter TctB family protein [Burkholderiales bacterium]|nr:tripartite tricarboxylate transporter TctB family protein [Burkholderiales bacterium]